MPTNTPLSFTTFTAQDSSHDLAKCPPLHVGHSEVEIAAAVSTATVDFYIETFAVSPAGCRDVSVVIEMIRIGSTDDE